MSSLRISSTATIACFFVAGAVALVPLFAQGPSSATGDEAAIKEVVRKYVEAREARDASQRARAMYTGDAFDRLEALGLVSEVEGAATVAEGVEVFLTGGHSRGHQGSLVRGGNGLLYLGDLLITQHHLPPAWVSALDDFPLDTIAAKREWLPRAAREGWWVAFSHDVDALAARLTEDTRVRELHR